MHNAVEIKTIVENFPLRVLCIEALEGDEERLLVGTPEGALLVIGEVEAPHSASSASKRFEVVETHKTFSKKPITQLQVLRRTLSSSTLLSLSELGVAVHHISLGGRDLTPVTLLTKTKSATMFKFDPRRGVLCVALKKRLLLYMHNQSSFQELKEVALPDTPRALAWCGERLCVGFRKEYSLLDLATGEMREVFPTGRSGCVDILELTQRRMPAWQADGRSIGASQEGGGENEQGGGGGVGGESNMGCGSVLGSSEELQELVLAKDSLGIFVGPDGRPTRKWGLSWSEPPMSGTSAALAPFVLALLPRAVEVRSAQPGTQQTLVQTLPLRDIRHHCPRPNAFSSRLADPTVHTDPTRPDLADPAVHNKDSTIQPDTAGADLAGSKAREDRTTSADAVGAVLADRRDGEDSRCRDVVDPKVEPSVAVYVASETAIFRLTQVPLTRQVEQLARSGDFEEALSLCDLFPEGGEKNKSVAALHLRFASSLFGQSGEFSEAMKHFALARANPLRVLRLFPAILAPICANTQLMFDHVEGEEDEDPAAEMSPEVFTEAVEALLAFLMTWRSDSLDWSDFKISGVPRLRERASGLADFQGSEVGERGNGDPTVDMMSVSDLATLVDTAILSATVVVKDATSTEGEVSEEVVRFVERPNMVDIAEGERILYKSGRHSELVSLLRAAGLHRRALALLQSLAQSPHTFNPPPPHPSPFTAHTTVQYLHALPEDPAPVQPRYTKGLGMEKEEADSKLSLVLEFSKWVLEAHESEGLRLFSQLQPPVPLQEVLPHIRRWAPHSALQYLETQLHQRGGWIPSEFHEELVLMYLDEVMRERDLDHAWTENTISLCRAKLLRFLQTSRRLSPERLLTRFPPDALIQERALLLWRAHRHRSALALHAHHLQDPALALQYCDRVYSSVEEGLSWDGSNDPSLLEAVVQEEGAPKDVYLMLLQVYLEAEEKGLPSMMKECLGLLSQRHTRMNGERVLSLMPASTPLHALMPFIQGVLRGSSEALRNTQVVKNLRRYENLQMREALIQCHQRSVDITVERACAMCHKRISNSVFAVHPNGRIVHYSCIQRTTPHDYRGAPYAIDVEVSNTIASLP